MRDREGIKYPPAPFFDPLASLISRDGLVDHSDNEVVVRNLNSLTNGLTNIHDLLPTSIDSVIIALKNASTKNVDGSQRYFQGSFLAEAPPSEAAVKTMKAEEKRIRAEQLYAANIAKGKAEKKAKKKASRARVRMAKANAARAEADVIRVLRRDAHLHQEASKQKRAAADKARHLARSGKARKSFGYFHTAKVKPSNLGYVRRSRRLAARQAREETWKIDNPFTPTLKPTLSRSAVPVNESAEANSSSACSSTCFQVCCKQKVKDNGAADPLPTTRAFGLGVVAPNVNSLRQTLITPESLFLLNRRLKGIYNRFRRDLLASESVDDVFLVDYGDCANVALNVVTDKVYSTPQTCLIPGSCLLDIFAAILESLKRRPSVSVQAVIFFEDKQYSVLVNSFREEINPDMNDVITDIPLAFFLEKFENGSGHIVCADVLPFVVAGLSLPPEELLLLPLYGDDDDEGGEEDATVDDDGSSVGGSTATVEEEDDDTTGETEWTDLEAQIAELVREYQAHKPIDPPAAISTASGHVQPKAKSGRRRGASSAAADAPSAGASASSAGASASSAGAGASSAAAVNSSAPHSALPQNCVECKNLRSDATGLTSSHGSAIAGVCTLNANAVKERNGWRLALIVVARILLALLQENSKSAKKESLIADPSGFFERTLYSFVEYIRATKPLDKAKNRKKSAVAPDVGILQPIIPFLHKVLKSEGDNLRAKVHGIVPPCLRTFEALKHHLTVNTSSVLVILNDKAEGASLEVSSPQLALHTLQSVLPSSKTLLSTSVLPFCSFGRSTLKTQMEAAYRLLEGLDVRKGRTEVSLRRNLSAAPECKRLGDFIVEHENDVFDTLDRALVVTTKAHICSNSDCPQLLIPVSAISAGPSTTSGDSPDPVKVSLKPVNVFGVENGPYVKLIQTSGKLSKKALAKLSAAQQKAMCLSIVAPYNLTCASTDYTVDRSMGIFLRTFLPLLVELFARLVDEACTPPTTIVEGPSSDATTRVQIVVASYNADTLLKEANLAASLVTLKNVRVTPSPSCGALCKAMSTNDTQVLQSFFSSINAAFIADSLSAEHHALPRIHKLPVDYKVTAANGVMSLIGRCSVNKNDGLPTRQSVDNISADALAIKACPFIVTGQEPRVPTILSPDRLFHVGTLYSAETRSKVLNMLNPQNSGQTDPGNRSTDANICTFPSTSQVDHGTTADAAADVLGRIVPVDGKDFYFQAPLPPKKEAIFSVPVQVALGLSKHNANSGKGVSKTHAELLKKSQVITCQFPLKNLEESDLADSSNASIATIGERLGFPSALMLARLTTKDFSFLRLFEGQVDCHIFIEALFESFVIAFDLHAPRAKPEATSVEGKQQSQLPSPSSKSSSKTLSSSSLSSSSQAKPKFPRSLHGDREIDGLISDKLLYASHPIPGKVDVALSLWAYCAGDWEMMKIVLASAEYIQPIVREQSGNLDSKSKRCDQENREAAMKQVIVAQFQCVRKITQAKGEMKDYLDSIVKPTTLPLFRKVLRDFDERFTDPMTYKEATKYATIAAQAAFDAAAKLLASTSTSSKRKPQASSTSSEAPIDSAPSHNPSSFVPPDNLKFINLMSRHATTIKWPVCTAVADVSDTGKILYYGQMNSVLSFALRTLPPSYSSFLSFMSTRSPTLNTGLSDDTPANRVIQAFKSQQGATNKAANQVSKAAFTKVMQSSEPGESERLNSSRESARKKKLDSKIGSEVYSTKKYARHCYLIELNSRTVMTTFVDTATGDFVTGRLINNEQPPSARGISMFFLSFMPKDGNDKFIKWGDVKAHCNGISLLTSSDSLGRLAVPRSMQKISSISVHGGTGGVFNYVMDSPNLIPGSMIVSGHKKLLRDRALEKLVIANNKQGYEALDKSDDDSARDNIILNEKREHQFRVWEFVKDVYYNNYTEKEAYETIARHHYLNKLPPDYNKGKPRLCDKCEKPFESMTDTRSCQGANCESKGVYYCFDCVVASEVPVPIQSSNSSSTSSSSSSSHCGELLCMKGKECCDLTTGAHKKVELSTIAGTIDQDDEYLRNEGLENTHYFICSNCSTWRTLPDQSQAKERRDDVRLAAEKNKAVLEATQAATQAALDAAKAYGDKSQAPKVTFPESTGQKSNKTQQSEAAKLFSSKVQALEKKSRNETEVQKLLDIKVLDTFLYKYFPFDLSFSIDPGVKYAISGLLSRAVIAEPTASPSSSSSSSTSSQSFPRQTLTPLMSVMLVRSEVATKAESTSTLPEKSTKKQGQTVPSSASAKRSKKDSGLSSTTATTPIGAPDEDDDHQQVEVHEEDMGQHQAITHKKLIAMAKAVHKGSDRKMLLLLRHFSSTPPTLEDTPTDENLFRASLLTFKGYNDNEKGVKSLWGDLLRTQKGLIKARIASSSSASPHSSPPSSPTSSPVATIAPNIISSASSSSSSSSKHVSMQDVYKDKELKKRLAAMMRLVRKNESLSKAILEANQEKTAKVQGFGKGAGDEIFKSSLNVRVADEAKSFIKKALEENTETTGPMVMVPDTTSKKRKRSDRKSPKEKPTLDEFKILKMTSEAALKAAIAAERNPAVLKAAAIVLAAKRRTAYRETTRKANSLFKRTSTYVCRLVGPGNTIILPPVNFANWFQGLSGGSTTSYMQTIGLAGGIDTLYKTAARFGINVVACNECYTSRECSNCRDCDFRGSGRTFTCSSCGLLTHRDAGNSVVNILIRALALGYDVDQALFNATAKDGAAASAAAAYAADAGGGDEE